MVTFSLLQPSISGFWELAVEAISIPVKSRDKKLKDLFIYVIDEPQIAFYKPPVPVAKNANKWIIEVLLVIIYSGFI